eukprot:7324127-Alexandrium_andersonii.AAC.1
MPLTIDVGLAFKETVLGGMLEETIRDAFTYCKNSLEGEPLGLASPARPMDEAVAISGQDASRSGSTGAIFGGCLQHLALEANAFGQSTDIGKIGVLLESMKAATDLKACVGTVMVNTDMVGDVQSGKGFLVRAHKDAEITAACLLLFFHRDAAGEVSNPVTSSA